jgi:hypothetical protein
MRSGMGEVCPLGESGTKILATLKSFALAGKRDGLDGRSGWSNGVVYRPTNEG